MLSIRTGLSKELPKPERTEKGKSLLEFPDTYVVVDIETTGLDSRYDEIIEISALKIKNNQIESTFDTLIKPINEIDEFITDLTGITMEMLTDAPFIDDVFEDFCSFIGENILVGHNVNFDINFLYDERMRLYGIPLTNNFVDTLRLSRRLLPDLKNHKLSTIAAALNVCVDTQHRALADTYTTNSCYLALKALEKTLNIIEKATERFKVKSKDIHTGNVEFREDCPIYGNVFCFTGTLEQMTRKAAMQHVVDLGGTCVDSITQKTNYLVLGNTDYQKSTKDNKTTKIKQAEKYILKGIDIKIISERIFYEMLGE